MGMLEEIEVGVKADPRFIIVYGKDGIGKSSLLAQVPDSVFAGPENRTQRLNVKRKAGLDTYEKNVEFVKELLTKEHKFKNLCFESADWLEKIIIEFIEKDSGKPINEAYGGYGGGSNKLDEMTREFVKLLNRLRIEKRMGVWVSAHDSLKDFSDPRTAADYTRFCLALRDRTADIWRQSVQAVLFCHFEVSKGKKDERAFSDGTRLLGTTWQAAYDAKNSFGLPDTISMGRTPEEGFRNLENAIENSEVDKVAMIADEINSLKHAVTDPARIKKMEDVKAKAIKEKDLDTLNIMLDQLKTLNKKD